MLVKPTALTNNRARAAYLIDLEQQTTYYVCIECTIP